jgi:RNA polymerase sigma-70 factor (ECF subfamily)
MIELITLVEPMVPALRRYIRALTGDRDQADDLVQDCLERVISRWGQRRNPDDTRQWVFAIAHNLATDYLRKRSRRGLHLAIEDVDEVEMAYSAPQEGHMQNQDLVRALETLPHEQRSVVLLVSVEDMSYAEVASTLNIPIGTVMSRLSRGREKLLQAMDGTKQDQPSQVGKPVLRRLK